MLELYDKWQNGNLEAARKIQQEKVIPLINILVKRSYPAGIKAALDLRGLHGGAPRFPLTPYNEQERNKLEQVLEEIS